MALPCSSTGDQTVSSLKSLQSELASVISTAQRAQEALAQTILGADARTKVLHAKIEDLEAQNLERAFKIRVLERENAELREQLAAVGDTPDSDGGRIAKERDRALRKLDKAHRVLKQLVRAGKASANPACTCGAAGSQQSSVAVGTVSSPFQPLRCVDSDDESTVRPPRSVVTTRDGGTPVPLATRTDRPRSAPVVPRTPVSSQESSSTISSASTSSDAASSASRARTKGKVDWYLQFEKSPATVEVSHGPIPFDVLSQQLGFDEDTEMEIGSLEAMPGYDTRIFYVGADVAFVFRPVVLEGPDSTCLIGWGSAELAKRVEASTRTLGDLNLFLWPMKQDAGWFYVGLHSLTFVELEPMWSQLRKADKQRLLEELSERNSGMNTAQFHKDVKEGKIVQCCVELESKGRVESLDFLREYGLLEAD